MAEKKLEELEKKEEPKVEGYSLVEVPTQHSIAIQTPSGELINAEQAMVELLNELIKIRKAVA